MKLNVIYRVCDVKDSVNGLPRPFNMKKDQVIRAGFKSLCAALQNIDHNLIIVGDNLSEGTLSFLKGIRPDAKYKLSDTQMGNVKSLLSCLEEADKVKEGELIFFCEDDYVFMRDAFTRMMFFYDFYAKFFKNVFYHPTDYPDQYLLTKLRPSYVLSHPLHGTFREVSSTTCTYALSKETYQKYANLIKDCAVRKRMGYTPAGEEVFSTTGADDGRLSEIFEGEAKCFSPILSSAAHLHVGTLPYMINWEKLIKTYEASVNSSV